jgi:hypothetical protein
MQCLSCGEYTEGEENEYGLACLHCGYLLEQISDVMVVNAFGKGERGESILLGGRISEVWQRVCIPYKQQGSKGAWSPRETEIYFGAARGEVLFACRLCRLVFNAVE